MEIRIQKGCTTAEIVEVLRACPDYTTVLFEKGTYDFSADGARRLYLNPVCNASGEKKVIFPFLYKKDITLDGQGSRFVFHDRVFPFAALGCAGITLRNFSVTFSFMRYCVADATLFPDGAALKIDASRWDYEVTADGNLAFRVGNAVISTAEKKFFLEQGNTHCFLGAGKRYYEPVNLPAAYFDTVCEKTADGVFLRYRDAGNPMLFSDGRLIISYDEDRENDNFFFDGCSDVKMENVTLYRGAGMGVVTQRCENVELSGLVFRPGENGDEVYSTTADGLFFTQDTGLVFIHGCSVTHTMDDAVSIHNIYTTTEQLLSDRKLRVNLCPSHSGFNPFVPGDTVLVTDGTTHARRGSFTVSDAVVTKDTRVLILTAKEALSDLVRPGDILENHGRSPRVIIRNNTFRSFPCIRLGSGKEIFFGMNTVSDYAAFCVNDLLRYWYAYGTSENVRIIGNTFSFAHSAAIRCTVDRNPEAGVCHGTVTVMRNRINAAPVGIAADHVRCLRLAHNAVGREIPEPEKFGDSVGAEHFDCRQLLMRRNSAPVLHTPLPDGYEQFVFHRGGDERMSMQTYTDGWFNVEPAWLPSDFEHFYQDDRIPFDGHFLIRRTDTGEIVAHSNIQLNEHKEGTGTVHFVAVKPECRGLRLGYCVSEMVLDYAEAHEIPVMYLTTDEFRIPAIKIYLKLGFRPVMWDSDMRERWFPILRELGCHEIYDEEENLITIDFGKET